MDSLALTGGDETLWLEMSRDEKHGGDGWAFTECLWSPTHKNPAGRWPFWESLLHVRRGQIVVHLRGKDRSAAFVGYSTARADGFTTDSRPPDPGQWSWAKSFHKVPLTDFVSFADPISLRQVFSQRERELRQFFEKNRQRSPGTKEHIFFVVQNNRLQCLNGAYLSQLSAELAGIVLGPDFSGSSDPIHLSSISARTGEQIAQIRRRQGQAAFSARVRVNYRHKCCFPGCPVADGKFLVGAHIDRWTDSADFRGDPANGLCMCLLHDKAFEIGLFTLTDDFRVSCDPDVAKSPWGKENLVPFEGQSIRLGLIKPATEVLRRHRERVGSKIRGRQVLPTRKAPI